MGPIPVMTVERIGYGVKMRDLPDRPDELGIIPENR